MSVIDYFSIENISLKEMGRDSLEEIQNLCDRCRDYFIIDQGQEADSNAALEILEALPPNKSHSDKHVLGVYDCNNKLIGLIDIVKGFVDVDEWMLGLLLIDTNERGKGLGSKIHSCLTSWVKNNNGSKIRIAVFDNNIPALDFWKRIGYKTIKKSLMVREGKKDKVVLVMNYNI